MRFSVDAWEPGYGTSFQDDGEALEASGAQVDLEVECPVGRWAPIPPSEVAPPTAVRFVDGVRRIDARVWVTPPSSGDATMGICGSYAAGVVCSCGEGAHLSTLAVRRGLFTSAMQATDVVTAHGQWPVSSSAETPGVAQALNLSLALQRKLAELEVIAAANARADHAIDDDLLVIDGPLRGRTKLERTVSLIKSHQASYLPPTVAGIVGELACGDRTPVFLLGTTWQRYTWYLRLPCQIESTWSGIVRMECSPERTPAEAVASANLTQIVIPTFASEPHKDARAPQNLYPIAGLETQLRHRLGHPQLLWRSLRQTAASGAAS